MVPVISTELFAAKITLASPVLSSKVIPDELVTALLKVTVLSSASTLPPVILIVGTVTASWNNAAPALLDVPTVKVSAAIVPVKVTVAGAPSALSITLISVVSTPAGSAMVPVTDLFVEVSNNKVPEFVIFAVTASLNVAVLLAALTILVAVTAAVNEELLFNVKTSNEVAPTIPVTEAVPLPRVKVKSLFVEASSLSIVELNVTLLLVVVSITSVLNVTAPVYVCVPDVVTLAARFDVVDTDNELALVISASKSRAPVIPIAPNAALPPTAPSNSISFALTVKVLVLPVLLTVLAVPENKISELVAVKVTLAPCNSPPAAV